MAMPSDKVFIDTNILVYAHLTLSPFHDAPVAKLLSHSKCLASCKNACTPDAAPH
jgi:predicted nucleic acid-binding protein